MIKIEKSIPIPADNLGRKSLYPFREMEVGDSFFAPNKTINQVSNCAWWAAKKTNARFTCRSENGGVRVWRVK